MPKPLILPLEEAVKIINSIIENIESHSYLIGIAGGSASGKGYLSKRLNGKHLLMDNYYKGRSKMKDSNFDHPDAYDFDLLKFHLKENKINPYHCIHKPVYNFETGERSYYEFYGFEKVTLIDGLYALHKEIRELLDLKIFVESSKQIRLKRRLERDQKERKKTKDQILKRWLKYVLPMYIEHIEPTKKYADIIVIN